MTYNDKIKKTIDGLEYIQVRLLTERRNYNGNILDKDDINEIQIVIEILQNLIIDNKYIWKKPKS